MEEYIKKLGRNTLIIAILLIAISILLITKSDTMINVIVMMIGYVFVTSGLIHVASYLKIEDEYRFFSYELAEGIINIILGILMVGNVHSVAVILPIALGVWIILEGILTLQVSLNIRGVRDTNWGIMCFMSLVSIALGFAMTVNPLSSLNIGFKVAGVILLITQLIRVYDAFYFLLHLEKANKAIKKAIKK